MTAQITLEKCQLEMHKFHSFFYASFLVIYLLSRPGGSDDYRGHLSLNSWVLIHIGQKITKVCSQFQGILKNRLYCFLAFTFKVKAKKLVLGLVGLNDVKGIEVA